MAITKLFFLSTLPILTLNKDSDKGPRKRRLMMCCNNPVSVNNLQIRSSDHKNKVFEDRSAGIVCYRDENGEITCEGYDEGPRFHQQVSRCISRDVDIIDLLQRCWLQVSDENE